MKLGNQRKCSLGTVPVGGKCELVEHIGVRRIYLEPTRTRKGQLVSFSEPPARKILHKRKDTRNERDFCTGKARTEKKESMEYEKRQKFTRYCLRKSGRGEYMMGGMRWDIHHNKILKKNGNMNCELQVD